MMPRAMLMPSLFRFVCILGCAVAVIMACVWALATFVEPHSRTIIVNVPVTIDQP